MTSNIVLFSAAVSHQALKLVCQINAFAATFQPVPRRQFLFSQPSRWYYKASYIASGRLQV